jgi:hypothetical protein
MSELPRDRSFLQAQKLELERLLEQVADHPLMAPPLRSRLQRVEQKLLELPKEDASVSPEQLRSALFFRRGGVAPEGIDAGLAGEALAQYQKMFEQQAIHDERELARSAGRKRRPKGASTPRLLLTGTPAGSFGFEFIPQITPDNAALKAHGESLQKIANWLHQAGDDDKSYNDSIIAMPSGVLSAMKRFFRVLANYETELRLVFWNDITHFLPIEKIKKASARLEREVISKDLELEGIFRGMTLESGHFDLITEDGKVISGVISDEFTEEDMEQLYSLKDKKCKFYLTEIIIQHNKQNRLNSNYLLNNALEKVA